MHKGNKKKTQRQTRKITREANTLEAIKDKGAYNSLKELNVIDKPL